MLLLLLAAVVVVLELWKWTEAGGWRVKVGGWRVQVGGWNSQWQANPRCGLLLLWLLLWLLLKKEEGADVPG
ncbi:hypothetical protein BD289DRAFT_443912 [Coniella lustricola]|uniref:Uncharacterized protein n=1 Tax=Coniella lustricola TaxID=2025994 RepID=A0A2T2ZWI6_9PEZI|nr:hypothetical protein BD289DRAFT_443912 [Coniella lustricola]